MSELATTRFSFCSMIFAISIRNFQKILKICLQTKIEDRKLRAEILDILHFTTYLVLSHRDKKDAYKIKISKNREKFGDYFQIIRQIGKNL
ncbi:hypothetical protein [Campylobacter rectus]|uniref:hypothetical protein n=1 Tax=Campylobacter rectus TaxID=203 RepID=UPI0028DB0DEC|nr:hypothetical protein [Campylobacter rectus]